MADLQDSRWRAHPYDYAQAHALASALGLSHTTASVLVRRGMGDAATARSFLEADEAHDPARFGGIDAAVSTVMRHVERGSMVAIHGDYDVDGVCSTALADFDACAHSGRRFAPGCRAGTRATGSPANAWRSFTGPAPHC